MLLSSLALLQHRIGFFGHEGVIWAFIGFLFLVIVVAILFKIMNLILPQLGVPAPWVSVIYWLAVLMCVILFMNYAFGGWF